MQSKPTVFVVDPSAVSQAAFTELAKSDDTFVEWHSSAASLLGSIDPACPGCVVADIELPDMKGVRLQKELAARGVTLPVIFLSTGDDLRQVVRAMKQGAMDVLEMPVQASQLTEVIRGAIDLDAKHRRVRAKQEDIQRCLSELTVDERSVMEQIIAGKTNKEVAAVLGVSLRTVQFRRSSLMRKLNVNSRAALIELLISTTRWPGAQPDQTKPSTP